MAGCRWSWIPYVSGGASANVPDLNVRLQVKGEAKGALRQGRLLAFGSTWCPVRILGSAEAGSLPPEDQAASDGKFFQNLRGIDWLQRRGQLPKEEADLVVEAHLPGAIAAQVRSTLQHLPKYRHSVAFIMQASKIFSCTKLR